MRNLFFAPALFLLLSFFSCSRAEPRILYGFMEKAYMWSTDGPQRRYSFFVLCEDDDGIENLSELHLFHDREGLRWLITSEDWIRFDEGGRNWIGSRHIAMHGGDHLPRGQFRAVLVNLGGERTERNFAFDVPEDSPHPFPWFSIQDGLFALDSLYPVNRLIAYDEQGDIVNTVTLTQIAGYLHDLNLPLNVIGVSLWAEDPLLRISALTEVVAVR
ncbi:MAG: hypothetical protein FWC65_04555 [Treponema sp.]|nr:hypothetical protein [Treponema sp.]